MSEPEVALVFSPEHWVDRLHRHCADHGGARIRQILVEPELALEESYDVLVVSHRWPALSRALVDALHATGRVVLGVYDPGEPVGADHLHGLGVDAVVGSDRAPAEIVTSIRVVATQTPAGANGAARQPHPADEPGRPGGAPGRVMVVAGPAGSGKTEAAGAAAAALHTRRHRCVLVDVDELAPSIGPRLGLPLGPTLRDAVDAAAHAPAELSRAVVSGPRGLCVVTGLPAGAGWLHVRAGEMVGLLDALARRFAWVVVDVGNRIEDVETAGRSRYGLSRAALTRADVVLAVADGSPNGVVRLLEWSLEARALARGAPFHVLVNRGPTDRLRRAELEEEVRRTFVSASFAVAPYDRRVVSAAWAGDIVTTGPFREAVERALDTMAPGLRADRLRTRRAAAARTPVRARPARASA